MQFLSGISVTCFVGSYLVALALELTRPILRIRGRMALVTGFTAAGLFTQLAYLVLRGSHGIGAAETGLLASWYDWALLLSWGLAACYLAFSIRRPDTTVGYFLLPPVLGLIAMAILLRDAQPFSRAEATDLWLQVHGAAMLLGALAVTLGLASGVMFLVQSYRLKHKKLASSGLKLPSLEWLQGLNRLCLVAGTIALAVGLLSGVVANLNRAEQVGWQEGGVILSGVLLLWLVAATAFEFFYRPARQGRKVAYLTLANFGFLVLAILGVLATPHGRGIQDPSADPESPAAVRGGAPQ